MKAILAALIIALILAAAPVPADATLYLPQVAAPQDWFTQAEFETALRNAGYDVPAVLAYTWAVEHPTSRPDALRYFEAWLELTPDNDSDLYAVRFWRCASGVTWELVTQPPAA